MDKVVYDEIIDGKHVQLLDSGHVVIDDKPATFLGDDKNRPWIPRKRKSFISIMKQWIRENGIFG